MDMGYSEHNTDTCDVAGRGAIFLFQPCCGSLRAMNIHLVSLANGCRAEWREQLVPQLHEY